MKLFPKLLLAAAGCLLAWGISVKAGHRPPRPQVPAGVTLATFETLSDLDLNSGFSQRRPGDILKRMPRSILNLDARKVLIQGFMMPTRLAKGQMVREFLLARSQASCCYGRPLQLCEVVEVRMAGKPAMLMMDRVISVIGDLHVKERWDGAFLGSIYQLDADSVTLADPVSAQVAALGAPGPAPGTRKPADS
jgi:hypothetical protein